ncbi:MAG TPA: HEAT repeat domain-containing protein [Pirellulales bacterium]|nr:HEAT repeat domain-containing protein [Pirellulales bacterium]
MNELLKRHGLCAAVLILAGSFGCQRGPKVTTSDQAAKLAAIKPKAKTTRETNIVRLKSVPAFREWGVRETAADALARIGDPALPALIATLQDPDHSIRAQAARALARMGPKAAPAVPELIVALDDSNEEVRQGAARALGQIGADAEEAVPALIKALKDPRNKPARPTEVESEEISVKESE